MKTIDKERIAPAVTSCIVLIGLIIWFNVTDNRYEQYQEDRGKRFNEQVTLIEEAHNISMDKLSDIRKTNDTLILKSEELKLKMKKLCQQL